MQTEQVFISNPLHLIDTVQPIFCSFVVGLSFERSLVIYCAKVVVMIMVRVMSSQLLRPTTAKTESPRKEQTDSLRLLRNDVTTQRVTRSNNDPWVIWEICSYDLLLIDLKISSHIRWPFRAGVGRAPTPSLEWSELCLDSLTWLVIYVPVTRL